MACGKKMAKETESTIGLQKQFNYALRADMTKAEFVKEVTTGLVDPPQYFPKNAVMNKMGYESIRHRARSRRTPAERPGIRHRGRSRKCADSRHTK